MGLLPILAIYISFILMLVFVLLFGPSPRFRHGIVGKMHVFITDTLWIHLGKGMKKLCGDSSISKLHGCWTYFSEQRNPSLQILYLFFITGSIGVFMNCGYELLDATTLSPIHKQVIIPVVIVFTYVCFFLASAIGPGEINSENVNLALDVYPYDYLLFYPKVCGTCKIQKPARSKHCSLCKACVPRSDHHCGWINQCVGHQNHRYFILFLYSAVQVCWYGTFLVYHIFSNRAKDLPLYKFLVATQRLEALGNLYTTQLFLYQMQIDRSLGALGVFAGLAGLVIFIFFIYNLYLIATGVTTNENFKWEEIGEMVYGRQIIELQEVDQAGTPIGPKRFEQMDPRHASHPYNNRSHPSQQQQQQQPQHPIEQQQPQQQPQHHAQPLTQENLTAGQTSTRKRVITKPTEIDNIYDQGVKENIKTILWPPSLAPTPPARRNGQRSIYERVQKSRKGA